jgi:hypothetical protein
LGYNFDIAACSSKDATSEDATIEDATIEDATIDQRIPKKDDADKKICARSTSLMLLHAMLASHVGAGSLMRLEEPDDQWRGKAAFLRCVRNFVNTENPPDYGNTIGKSAKQDVMNETFECVDRLLEKVTQNLENEKRVSKVSVSLATLFLHVDQGCLPDTTYTPMASPTVNVRSVDIDHVNELLEKVNDRKDILAIEDYAVVGYMTATSDVQQTNEAERKETKEGYEEVEGEETRNTEEQSLSQEPQPDEGGLPYRCILNQDEISDEIIFEKTAKIFTTSDLSSKCFKTVSYF